MKKIYNSVLLLFCLLLASQANSTTHTISVLSSSFSPNTLLSVNVGDTIVWMYTTGTHTTTSSTIPAGAASWDSPISSTTPSFEYVATTPGIYGYFCQPHGFSGQFSVDTTSCHASFTWFGPPPIPTPVTFQDLSSSNNPIQSWLWDFGDGNTSNIQNPVHTYVTGGTFMACLTIDDGMGCTNMFCDSIISSTIPTSINVYFDVDSMNLFNCSSPYGVTFLTHMTAQGYTPGDTFDFDINFGDGIDSSFSMALTSLSFQTTIDHVYQNAGSYNATMTVTGSDSLFSTYTSQTIIVAASCGTISGIVYNDVNSNCVFDSGEELPNIYVSIYSGSSFRGWAITDANGEYFFNAPAGTYDVHVNSLSGSFGHFTPTCPPTGIISVSTVPSSGNNLGVACPSTFDLQGTVNGWGFRPGFTTSVCVYAFNQSCTTPNGQIEVTLSPNVTPLPDSTGVGYTVSGNTVTLQIDNTELYWSFCIPVVVDVNAQIGDSVCVDLNITPTTGDSNPLNNSGRFCFPVRNSWDPNDKAANPAGEGVEGYIRPNTDLTYTIRFQNTGSAEAFNIYILDTISTNLDASSIEVVGFSHPMTYSLLLGNILRFNFDNIMLPDSNANEPASHGYVTYRIKQSPTIAQMAQITNTAYIYFDFNQPVVTNTTLNTMDQFLSAPVINKNSSLVNLFPNPANQKCMIYFGDKQPKTISVSDILGKEVFRVTTSTESYLLNTEKFVNGIYTVQISNSNNQLQKSKLIIAH